ncbi:MAG: DNA-processing protein DprA [Gemmatimonadota bacterium]|nr:MAG: DNA-processing protein DprA [Gemmatimonadota bacterium]
MRRADLSYVALALTPGIGRGRMDALLSRFHSADAVLRQSHDALSSVRGMSSAAATAVRNCSHERALAVVDRAERLGGVVLIPRDARFPAELRTIPESPTLLFALGRLELLQRAAVAIVGSRRHTRYGAEACRHFAGGLARAGLVVVSGMARGLDAVAHAACLDAGGGTVGVLGNGLGVVYPAANRALYERVAREGCLVTEFPPGERPNAGSFPRRNRVISGLARATLVVEAGSRSGALITAGCALDQAREVLAVPGPVTSPLSVGCNRLVRSGAKPALDLDDVLEEYGLAAEAAPELRIPADLSDAERRLLNVLAAGECHPDGLAESVGAPVADTLAVLTGLEIRGLVEQDPGKVFRRATSLGRLVPE